MGCPVHKAYSERERITEVGATISFTPRLNTKGREVEVTSKDPGASNHGHVLLPPICLSFPICQVGDRVVVRIP